MFFYPCIVPTNPTSPTEGNLAVDCVHTNPLYTHVFASHLHVQHATKIDVPQHHNYTYSIRIVLRASQDRQTVFGVFPNLYRTHYLARVRPHCRPNSTGMQDLSGYVQQPWPHLPPPVCAWMRVPFWSGKKISKCSCIYVYSPRQLGVCAIGILCNTTGKRLAYHMQTMHAYSSFQLSVRQTYNDFSCCFSRGILNSCKRWY